VVYNRIEKLLEEDPHGLVKLVQAVFKTGDGRMLLASLMKEFGYFKTLPYQNNEQCWTHNGNKQVISTIIEALEISPEELAARADEETVDVLDR